MNVGRENERREREIMGGGGSRPAGLINFLPFFFPPRRQGGFVRYLDVAYCLFQLPFPSFKIRHSYRPTMSRA